MYGQGAICIQWDGEAWLAYKRTGIIFFSFFLSNWALQMETKFKAFWKPAENVFSAYSAYSIFPCILFFTSCHHVPFIHHGCFTACAMEKAPKCGMSFHWPGFLLSELKANYSLKTKHGSLELWVAWTHDRHFERTMKMYSWLMQLWANYPLRRQRGGKKLPVVETNNEFSPSLMKCLK